MPKTHTSARILNVVRLVLETPVPCTFSDIQKTLDLPKSTLSGMLQELVELSVLAYDERGKTYCAGTALITMSALCMARLDAAREIALVLDAEALRHAGATFHAGILSGATMVYTHESAGKEPLAGVRPAAPVLPAHACALGKALLAGLDDAALEALYQSYPFEPYTDQTITNFKRLRDEMQMVRAQGYATDAGELSPYVACLAVALPFTGGLPAAISMTVPMGRFTPDTRQQMFATLAAARKEITARMGVPG